MYPLIEQYLRRPSSMTRSVFCQEHGLSFDTFRYWFRSYKSSQVEPTEERISAGEAFVELKPRVVPETVVAADALLEIVFPGGTAVRFFKPVDPDYVAKLMAHLPAGS